MKCEQAMEAILRLDNGAEPDATTQGHLSNCPRCRAEYSQLRRALDGLTKSLENASDVSAPDDLHRRKQVADRIMSAVRAEAERVAARQTDSGSQLRRQTAPASQNLAGDTGWIAYSTWISVGVLLLLGIIVLPYTEGFLFLRGVMERDLDAPLALTLGLVMSGYWALFIGTHIADLRRRLRRLHRAFSRA